MNDEQTPALRQAVENMATMREAYDNLSQAAEAYNTGKVQLAQNITSKGVEASATETLPELAEKVSAISQESYTIDGGEMYAKQLFGSLETPNYWNLYEVLAQLLSDGRLVSYGGILLAEYYRGYDSLALAGAGAGGAYVVSDLDENGQFKMYTEDTMHTWDTEFDGHGNRWVAYCFADEYHDFQITDTNTSPRSIFIGRKVGTITSLVAGRVSQIVVPDGNELISFTSSYTQNWSAAQVIRNLKHQKGNLFTSGYDMEKIYVSADTIEGTFLNVAATSRSYQLNEIILEIKHAINAGIIYASYTTTLPLREIIIKGIEDGMLSIGIANSGWRTGDINSLYLLNVGGGNIYMYPETVVNNFKYIYISQKDGIDKRIKFSITGQVIPRLPNLKDVELQDGWCKSLDIAFLQYLTKENVQAHIFDKLGVNDTSTGAVTITLANAVLNLFTQEEIDAVVARTNITIVGA